jgi:hypothetical protein
LQRVLDDPAHINSLRVHRLVRSLEAHQVHHEIG